MSGRATGEERSPLSTLDRERERERRPSLPPPFSRFTIEEASTLLPPPSPPRCARFDRSHADPPGEPLLAEFGGEGGGRREHHRFPPRRDRFLDSAVDRGHRRCIGCFESGCARMDRSPRISIRRRLDPPSFFSSLSHACSVLRNLEFRYIRLVVRVFCFNGIMV